jgi:hypothetical protein
MSSTVPEGSRRLLCARNAMGSHPPADVATGKRCVKKYLRISCPRDRRGLLCHPWTRRATAVLLIYIYVVTAGVAFPWAS